MKELWANGKAVHPVLLRPQAKHHVDIIRFRVCNPFHNPSAFACQALSVNLKE